jgi:hypothetical protein
MDMYILITLSELNGKPDITSRFLEVRKDDGEFEIVRSEFSYLGEGTISAELDEDENGLYYFSFTSDEKPPRQFLCEDSDSSEYMHGDILENDEEAGEFILRKVSDAQLP